MGKTVPHGEWSGVSRGEETAAHLGKSHGDGEEAAGCLELGVSKDWGVILMGMEFLLGTTRMSYNQYCALEMGKCYSL